MSNVTTWPPLDFETFFSNRMPARDERMRVLPAAIFGDNEVGVLARCDDLLLRGGGWFRQRRHGDELFL